MHLNLKYPVTKLRKLEGFTWYGADINWSKMPKNTEVKWAMLPSYYGNYDDIENVTYENCFFAHYKKYYVFQPDNSKNIVMNHCTLGGRILINYCKNVQFNDCLMYHAGDSNSLMIQYTDGVKMISCKNHQKNYLQVVSHVVVNGMYQNQRTKNYSDKLFYMANCYDVLIQNVRSDNTFTSSYLFYVASNSDLVCIRDCNIDVSQSVANGKTVYGLKHNQTTRLFYIDIVVNRGGVNKGYAIYGDYQGDGIDVRNLDDAGGDVKNYSFELTRLRNLIPQSRKLKRVILHITTCIV